MIELFDVDLSTITTTGVYVIYRPGSLNSSPTTIRVGQGNVSDRLAVHRKNLTIRSQLQRGPVLVAFAAVSPVLIDGVERYLGDYLRPLIGEAFPNAKPVPVNLPFAA